jgi:hypothetical protein
MASTGINDGDLKYFCYTVDNDPILKQLNQTQSKSNSELSQQLTTIFQGQEWNKSWDQVRKVLSDSFVSKDFSKLRIDIRKILLNLEVDQSKNLLNDLANKAISEDLPQLVNQVLELFSCDEIVAIGQEDVKFESARIETMAKSATFLEALKHSDPSPSGIQKTYHYVVNFIHSTFDTILMAFSFFEIGQEPGSSWEASHMLQVYGQLFSMPLILITFLSTMMSSPAVAVLTSIGVLAGLLTILLVYVKYFKPPPENMKDVVDISAMVEKGLTIPVIGYEADVRVMLNYIMSGEKPILVGKSRIGKSIRCLALAQYLYNNRNNPALPDWVKKLRVKYTNAADMVGMAGFDSGGGDKIARLRNRSEKFWPNILWFIDEGHIPVSPQYFAKSGTQFNILLDKLPSSFPHAIVATTDQGFSFILQSDLNGRLKPMLIEEPEQDTLMCILRARAEIRAPEMNIPEEVFRKIIEYSKVALPGQLQPNISLSILEQTITSIRFAQMQTQIEKELQVKQQELGNLSRMIFHGGINRITPDIIKQREDCEKAIGDLEQQRAEEIKLIKELVHLKEMRLKQNRVLNSMCQQILLNSGKIENINDLKNYYFVRRYVLDNFELKIKALHDKLKLPILNADYIKDIIDKQAAMKVKIAAAAAPPSALFDALRR